MSQSNRILVVDDEIQNRRLFEDLLASFGYSAESACDGFEALEKLNSSFDLVLMDVRMPGMDGFEVIRRIRDNPDVSHIPIIMVTVLDDRETRLNAVQAGANDFIAKPVDRIEVFTRVESLLKMKLAQDALRRYRSDLEETLEKRTLALFESEKRFVTLFEAAQDCIFIKDRNLRYIEVNRAVLDFVGISLSEIIGKNDNELFGQAYHGHTLDIESRVLQDQVIENQETLMWQSYRTHWSIIRFPIKDGLGQITGICGIARQLDGQAVGDFERPVDPDGPHWVSPAMRSTLAKAAIASKTTTTILLTWETGAGKDYLARYIHDCSSKTPGPFVAVNCAAIPSELAESELFGHEAGAFTGANRKKRGLVELAEGGTLLLNEIGELPLSLQAKLLTFLDTFSFTRVGGEKLISVNLRLIAATGRDLDTEISQGRFRGELFFRLNVFPIHVPPLRERKEDIPHLASEILSELCRLRAVTPTPTIDSKALDMFVRYSWPGNVREMKNILERSLILSQGGTIKVQHTSLPEPHLTRPLTQGLSNAPKGSFNDIVGETEQFLIKEALLSANGNKQEAARLLGISRFALARHMKKLGINGR